MKIALVHCPLWGTFDPPIGVAQFSSYLKKQGCQVETFDLNIKLYLNQNKDQRQIWAWEESDFWYSQENINRLFSDDSGLINDYIEWILKDNIRIVGFSVNTTSRLFSLEFARRLKAKDKKLISVFGGPIFLRKNSIDNMLNDDCVDIVIPGEGFLAFSGLIAALKSGRKIDSCKGLVFKRKGTVINTGPAPLVELDNLPFLDLTGLPLNDYDNGAHISLMTGRGCVRRCFFCSDAPCWLGYRAMSGRRIFQEVKFHKDKYKRLGHIDFMDLAFNGNMKSLIEFCDLMITADLDLSWTANMFIRPQMTLEVIKKMKAAKCEHIIIGVESGSERVLKLMNKYYKMADADRIIRQMYDAEICLTANFMFGFPGETEKDFKKTLDFLRRNGKYMGVYPSRTYCALEEFSYLEKHPNKFGIKPNPSNHLFWHSVDGKNTFPVRMDRCRRFCELALELGVEVSAGVQTAVELDEWFNLACYYESIRDYPKAVTNFLHYFRENPTNTIMNNKLLSLNKRLSGCKLDRTMKDNFEKAIEMIVSGKIPQKRPIRQDRPLSSAYVKLQMDRLSDEIERHKKEKDSYSNTTLLINKISKNISCYRSLSQQQKDNLSDQFKQFSQRVSTLPLRQINQCLNEAGFKEKKVWLDSLPADVYLPLAKIKEDDFRYIFEPQEGIRGGLNLEQFKRFTEPKINTLLLGAKRCILKENGNFALDSEGGNTLDYLEQISPGLEKELFTKGVNFSKKVINSLSKHASSYIINFALHASHRDLHRKISNKDNFDKIRENLGCLSKVQKKNKNIVLNLTYTAAAINIVDLPNIIKLAVELGVNKVFVDYNRIYTAEHRDISCFFRQDLTNKIFDIVQAQAKYLNLIVQLPPKFNQDFYPEPIICRNPWSQFILNSEGKVFPCEHFRICGIEFGSMEHLQGIWNSRDYKTMRICFGNLGYSECSMFCYYANPRRVNSLRSHIFNAKYFGWKDNQELFENSSLDLDEDAIEKVIDLAECCLFSNQDYPSSERIIRSILEKVSSPARLLRLLARMHREEAEIINSAPERGRLLKLAQSEIEKSLSSGVSDPWVHAEAARIYSVLGYTRQAKAAIKKALSLAPQQEKFKLLKQELEKN